MLMRNNWVIALAIAFGWVVSALPVQAALLPPPTSGPVIPGAPGAAPTGLLATTGVKTYAGSVGGLPLGTVIENVYANPSNVFGAGLMTFVYQFTVNATPVSGGNDVGRLSATLFDNWSASVFTSASGPLGVGGVAPTSAGRASGDVIFFDFTPPVPNAGMSFALQIDTNAPSF